MSLSKEVRPCPICGAVFTIRSFDDFDQLMQHALSHLPPDQHRSFVRDAVMDMLAMLKRSQREHAERN